VDYDEPNQDQKEILENSQENGPGDRNRRERDRAFRKVEPHKSSCGSLYRRGINGPSCIENHRSFYGVPLS